MSQGGEIETNLVPFNKLGGERQWPFDVESIR